MTAQDRSMLIKAAPDVQAPLDLATDIRIAIAATPQRRPALGGRVGARFGAQRLSDATPRLAWVGVVVAVALAALVALAVASRLNQPSDDILSYHGNQAQTGVVPGPAPVGPVAIAWQASLDGSVTALEMPLVYAGSVYQSDDHGSLSAFDEDTGILRWTRSGFGTASSGPVITGGLVVVAGSTGTVVAFDATTGQERWRHEVHALTLAPLTASGERIFVASEDGDVHVLDRGSGAEIGMLAAGGPVERSPAIADRTVYVAAVGGHITAFDATTDALRWTTELGDGEVATPAVAAGALYVARGSRGGSTPYEVVSVDASNGKERWRWATPDYQRLFIGAVSATTVYAVSEDGNVYAIDIETHEGRRFFATGGPIEAPATIANGQLFFSSADRTVYSLDLESGSVRWKVPVTGVPFTPAVSGGRVFVGTDLGRLVAIGGSGSVVPSP
jgi:eukaryotic-like serine/threonine-protein kinase